MIAQLPHCVPFGLGPAAPAWWLITRRLGDCPVAPPPSIPCLRLMGLAPLAPSASGGGCGGLLDLFVGVLDHPRDHTVLE